MYKYREGNCKFCGKKFIAKKDYSQRHQIFCSKYCYGQNLQKERYCAHCSIKLIYSSINQRTNKKFCSRRCAVDFRRKGITEEHRIKISQSHIGIKLSSEHRKALSNAKKGILLADKSPVWKGNKVGRIALHDYIRRRVKSTKICSNCGKKVNWIHRHP